ncbi:uncharacterized protein ARMOST_03852 [Armillaria ostoyae]|uniref:DUF6535 domain-containing protein n=1 Tax=Armillaria ostoyae TaxID=47428 RepID=A0A284QVS6_ARMOS|nr:uncharacterized protein ARMOST_03852 [Armillaria ostoyae]
MSISEIDRTSTLNQEQDNAIVREDAEAEEPGIGGDGGHGQTPAKQEVESNEGEEEDKAPAAAPPTFVTAANAKTAFGMKRSNPTVKKGNDSYDYEQKYSEDAPYEEAAPAARVWRTYEDESRNHDANMVEESRDNVDVLLVFAGLFSAVVTTFVVQTSQSLQPDYTAMSASLLYESILVQRAIANGSSVNTIAPSPLNPIIAFVPATTDVWVNGLWFTSLFLSLTTALVAVLVKQWLHHYVALPSGTPRDRSFTRQLRYGGFKKWHVQVIIGLLPVLMHLALAIFLSGLVIFLHPLQVALSWFICAGTVLVYTAYAVATILPILFPQCPYRTPLCNLVYVSLRHTVPRVTWSPNYKRNFLSSYRQRDFSAMFRYLPSVRARTPQSLTTIESTFVQQRSTDLAAEALDWLFSVSSNPTVQSIVVQSVGGLPMASEEKLLALQGDNRAMDDVQDSVLKQSLQMVDSSTFYVEPVRGMELRLGRLLRFYPRLVGWYSFAATPDLDLFELTTAILSNGYSVEDGETFESVCAGAFFMDIARSSKKLPPCHWYRLMMAKPGDVFQPLDPDNDDHANAFPLHLCSAILWSFDASQKADFNSPLVLDFKGALPYFLDKIYDDVLSMFSKFIKDPSLVDVDEPSSLKSLRVLVVAIKFLLHRLSLPDSDMSHTTICHSLIIVNWQIWKHTFSLQEATAVMPVLEDIIARCAVPPFNIDSDDPYWGPRMLWSKAILAYQNLTTITPSACSLRGLQSMVDLMTHHWDEAALDGSCLSDTACEVLAGLLVKRIPVAFTVFREEQCLQFLGNHAFHEASVPMVSAYIAGISAMQRGSNADAATLQLHIDYIHNPPNIFTACSILATHSINTDRTAIHRDITRLVQLCPRDAAWDECRGKLRDLVQSDGGNFFSEQRLWSKSDDKFRRLQPDEIQVEKDNIRYAIHVLDDFFDGRVHTNTGLLDRFFGWCLGRKPKDKPEEEQQV